MPPAFALPLGLSGGVSNARFRWQQQEDFPKVDVAQCCVAMRLCE